MFLKNKTPKQNPLFNSDKHILKQVKEKKLVIYGARAIQKHIGFVSRKTKDWDIFSRRPNKSAKRLVRTLNTESGTKNYYLKPAEHPGTFKVKDVGLDKKKNTKDDLEVADFTKPERKVKTVVMDGVRYTALSESVKDKKKALADKESSFRHEKDKDDLSRIKFAKKYKIKYRNKRRN